MPYRKCLNEKELGVNENKLLEERLLQIAEPNSKLMGDKYLRYAKKKYFNGLNFKKCYPDVDYISIAINGVWSASGNGVFISGYEKIGYHTCSSAFYEGLVDSDIGIKDYRKENK